MKIIVSIVQFFIISIEFSKEVFVKELYFENENVFQYDKAYAININNDQLDELDNNFDIEILKEIKLENEKQIELNGNEKIFNQNNNNNTTDIVLLKYGSIECLYEIQNYIQDDDIIIKQKDCQILLNQQDCIKLYKIDQYIYIIQCNYNTTNTIIQILNQSQIFDQIIIPIQSNCQSDSIFNHNNQTLIIYNKLCQTTLFYSIQIQNLLFYNLTKYDLQDDFYVYNIPNSILMDIQFCSSEQIIINFQNIFISYLLHQKEMTIQNRLQNNEKVIQRFQSCESYYNYIEDDVKTKQLLLRKKQINISSEFIIQSYLIQQLLIVHKKDELIALFNKKVKQHLIISFQNLLVLTELPFIFAIKDKHICIFKINYPQHYFTVIKDHTYIKKIKINSGLSHLDYQQIEIFTQQNLQFLLQSSKISHFIQNLNTTICIDHKILQKTNPFEIQIIQQKSNIFFNQQNSILELCLIQILSNRKIIIIQEQDVQSHIILMIQDNILSIFTCQENKFKYSQKIKIEKDYINIYSFPNVFQIVIIYKYKIILIDFKHQQIIQQIKNLNLLILNSIQDFYQIYIIFEDCTKAIININQGQFQIVFEQEYPFDCNLSLQLKFNEVFITQDEILFSENNNFKRKLFNLEGNKNIMTIVLQQYLIIVRQVQNEYLLKLFYMHQEQAIYMYNLPTYDYKIKDSIQYQTFKSYLMIRAQKQNRNYLLIYDVSKKAILSLIQITKIDQDEIFFQFLSQNQILYYLQGQFIIKNIISTCFNYWHNFKQDNFLLNEEFTFKIISQINNEILLVNFELIILNNDYNLRLINQEYTLGSNNIINLSNIYGNIEKIEIFPQEDYQIIYPLTFTLHEQNFINYKSAVCYNFSNRIIINCFEDNQFVIYENTMQNILHIANYQNKTFYKIFYESTTEDINLMLINIKQDQLYMNIEKVQIPEQYYKHVACQNYNTNIIKTTQNITIFVILFGENYVTFNNIYMRELFYIFNLDKNLEAAYLYNSTYLFISEQIQFHIIMKFITFTQVNDNEINYDIKLDYTLTLNTIIPESLISLLFYSERTLKIFEIQIIQDQIHFEIGIFFHYYFALLIQFSIDKKIESIPNLQSSTILRYQFGFKFIKLLYLDNNFAIVILTQNEIDEFVYVYDIRRRNIQNNIDSIQKLVNQNYTGIERYNQSHYVFKQYDKNTFIILDELKFSCQSICSTIKSIQFSNEISTIQIEIQNVQKNKIKSVQVYIIITTLIYIILLIKKYKKRKNNNIKTKCQQNQQNQ